MIRSSTDIARLLKRRRTSVFQPRTAPFCFFFFFDVLAKLRQLSTRCSRFSVGWRENAREDSYRVQRLLTFPPGIIFCFAFLSCDFFFLLASLKTFIGKVHLDSSVIKHSVEENHTATEATDAPSSSKLLFNQYILRFLPKLRLEWRRETL
jgi:hypothetical protein